LVPADLLRTAYFLTLDLHSELGDITEDSESVLADGHVQGVVALLPQSADVHPVLVLLVFDHQVILFGLVEEGDEHLLVALLFPFDVHLDVLGVAQLQQLGLDALVVIIHVDFLTGLAVYFQLVLVETTLGRQLGHFSHHLPLESFKEPTVDLGQPLGWSQLLIGDFIQIAMNVSFFELLVDLSPFI